VCLDAERHYAECRYAECRGTALATKWDAAQIGSFLLATASNKGDITLQYQ
jgi:hypothetical protein